MKPACRHLLMGLFLIYSSTLLASDDISDVDNYRQYNPYFSSSGQPSAGQLKALSEAGFERVIYLAFTDNKTAIGSEDRIVKSLGMDYLHIPVDFDRPMMDAKSDLDAIWQPDKTWYGFIVEVLNKHGLSYECEGCDWGSNEFKD